MRPVFRLPPQRTPAGGVTPPGTPPPTAPNADHEPRPDARLLRLPPALQPLRVGDGERPPPLAAPAVQLVLPRQRPPSRCFGCPSASGATSTTTAGSRSPPPSRSSTSCSTARCSAGRGGTPAKASATSARSTAWRRGSSSSPACWPCSPPASPWSSSSRTPPSSPPIRAARRLADPRRPAIRPADSPHAGDAAERQSAQNEPAVAPGDRARHRLHPRPRNRLRLWRRRARRLPRG